MGGRPSQDDGQSPHESAQSDKVVPVPYVGIKRSMVSVSDCSILIRSNQDQSQMMSRRRRGPLSRKALTQKFHARRALGIQGIQHTYLTYFGL